jgi:hypothetical protein
MTYVKANNVFWFGTYLQGANFRSLPGVIVREDNTVALDPAVERVLLPSGKPLVCMGLILVLRGNVCITDWIRKRHLLFLTLQVPDYAITFVKGRSPK